MTDSDGATGFDVLRDPAINKSTAFTDEERDRLKLRGLLPAAVCPQPLQLERVLANIRRKNNEIEKYIFLTALQSRNERLYYRTLIDNIDELMPVVYTPTVGQACKEFAQIFRQTKGFYVTPEDRGRVRSNLDNWPEEDVRVVVVTDGQRILGLGDLGASGMGIPIGKLALYVACAGINPNQCLPVMLDVGTDNEEMRNDPLYLGINGPRLTGQAYYDLVEEFVVAVHDKFPKALIQFEDFLTPNAYHHLNAYRDRVLCFNDDIQGTAAVALAGVYASTRISRREFGDLTIMFLGAGSAATGIADLMVPAFEAVGLSNEEARRRLWFVDEHGLLTERRDGLGPHNLPYAHDHAPASFVEAIHALKPDVLIGATGAPGTFTEGVVGAMAEVNETPAIFALSNPTSRAECTAEQAYDWSNGTAIFASGSPFAPVMVKGEERRPGQGNNAYIFPGIGLGAVFCGARRIDDAMFLAAARALADRVDIEDLATGAIYPPLKEIRSLSLSIAVAVAEVAYEEGLASAPKPDDLKQAIADTMYDPRY
jgi:malate dehydrogenase (oxaloacetate-decarboxylating)(NADP+)